jgi:hypothetical protein
MSKSSKEKRPGSRKRCVFCRFSLVLFFRCPGAVAARGPGARARRVRKGWKEWDPFCSLSLCVLEDV